MPTLLERFFGIFNPGPAPVTNNPDGTLTIRREPARWRFYSESSELISDPSVPARYRYFHVIYRDICGGGPTEVLTAAMLRSKRATRMVEATVTSKLYPTGISHIYTPDMKQMVRNGKPEDLALNDPASPAYPGASIVTRRDIVIDWQNLARGESYVRDIPFGVYEGTKIVEV